MPRTEYLPDVRDGVRRGEERAVEPAPALRDELGQRVGDVSLADRGLDVFEDPIGVCFRYELEAEDTLGGALGCILSVWGINVRTSSARSGGPGAKGFMSH